MKPTNIFIISLAAMTLIIVAGGSVMAQTISTNGDVSQSDSLVWKISTGSVDGPLVPGEVRSTTTYNENTQGQDGLANYFKTFNFNTGNANIGQNNIDSRRVITFDGTKGQTGNGRLISDESLGIETMGLPANTSTWPAFHNIVQTGSSVDLLRGQVVTNGQSRTVSADPDTPVNLVYNINVHGMTDSTGAVLPAIGSTSAFINGHLEQGRVNSTQKAQDIVFSHQSGASGFINAYSDNMNYVSGPKQMAW